jgi:signal transduction histidine kinase
MFGTGLGLPIVRQIVEQHGGDVELTSDPGMGTRACISLPIVEKAAAGRGHSERAHIGVD